MRCVRVCGQLPCHSSQWARLGVPAEHTLYQKVDVCRVAGVGAGAGVRGGGGGGAGGEREYGVGLYKSGSEE